MTEGWTKEGCERIVWLAQLTIGAGVLAATILQLVGALCVREYARSLWRRQLREEEAQTNSLRGVDACEKDVILEEKR